ncbi:MAG: polysaccharide pyruvyl transferase family protein [Steroidobacteraceae bacterium]
MSSASVSEFAATGRAPGLRIVLTGTYNSANKGDAAMELGALNAIRDSAPDSQVTILSPFPGLDAPFYAPVSVRRCNRRNLVAATLDLVRAAIWRLLFGRSRRPNALLSEPLRLVNDADLVIDLSGDMLTDEYGPHVAYSHYVPLLRALVMGKPYFICAQSLGPFNWTRPLARWLLRRAAEVTVRDSISRRYVAAMGVRRQAPEQTADLAFLLCAAAPGRTLEILRREWGFEPAGKPILGISVSQLIEGKYKAARTDADDDAFVRMMRRVVVRTAREWGARVIFVAHVTGPSRIKDDRVIAARIADGIGAEVETKVLAGDYRPEELKAIIATCRVFCGARMHANISALSSGVPTVAISYSHKTEGIMSDFGMGDFVVSAATITEASLGALLSRAFREREAIALQLRERGPAMAALALRNFAGLRQLARPHEAEP